MPRDRHGRHGCSLRPRRRPRIGLAASRCAGSCACLRTGLRIPPRPKNLEVGPGTGQATRDLLRRGAVLHAIEIGPAMAAKLRANLPSAELRVTIGDFERVDVPDRSMDAVFSATAYHWVTPAAQLDRPATILKSGGVVAIVDLNQVDSP